MKRTYCDGCDDEIRVPETNHCTTVTIESPGIHPQNSGVRKVYDLCLRCRSGLVQKADPTNWPRMAKEEPRHVQEQLREGRRVPREV